MREEEREKKRKVRTYTDMDVCTRNVVSIVYLFLKILAVGSVATAHYQSPTLYYASHNIYPLSFESKRGLLPLLAGGFEDLDAEVGEGVDGDGDGDAALDVGVEAAADVGGGVGEVELPGAGTEVVLAFETVDSIDFAAEKLSLRRLGPVLDRNPDPEPESELELALDPPSPLPSLPVLLELLELVLPGALELVLVPLPCFVNTPRDDGDMDNVGD